MIKFNKKSIYFGLKKRFIKIEKNKFFCFYDGFGVCAGTTRTFLDSNDYRNATAYDVEKNIDEIQEQMSTYKKVINKMLKRTDSTDCHS